MNVTVTNLSLVRVVLLQGRNCDQKSSLGKFPLKSITLLTWKNITVNKWIMRENM